MMMKAVLPASGLLTLMVLGHMYADSLSYLGQQWWDNEDYGHGLFVPVVSMFLAWNARQALVAPRPDQPWWGCLIIVAGLALYWVGELATLYVVVLLSLWVLLVGLVVSLMGLHGARILAFPLSYLLLAIPLPTFLTAGLTSRLQLWSSALGVECLQLFGVTAFRDGNVIDLGAVQLQVIEACSGIRYLLPLTALAVLCAYFYSDKFWKRALLVASAVPIAVLVNGLRIGLIGMLIERYGRGVAEGFYHLFEGWLLFMTSLGLLLLEAWVLARVGRVPVAARPLAEPRVSPSKGHRAESSRFTALSPSPAYLCSVALLIPCALGSPALIERQDQAPPRLSLTDFPMSLQDWTGTRLPLEKTAIDALRLDDYLLADYRAVDNQSLHLYVAYYGSQVKGRSAHSPQSCLPGGGWEITSLSQVTLTPASSPSSLYPVNRAIIRKDQDRQVVLYWFKQRDRIVSDEYLVKLYLLWDGLVRGRTDGALVRVSSPVGANESVDAVEQRLVAFSRLVQPELAVYVPD